MCRFATFENDRLFGMLRMLAAVDGFRVFCEKWESENTTFASRCSIVCRIATSENGRGPGCLRVLATVDVLEVFVETGKSPLPR